MRKIISVILIVILAAVIIQPLIETANVLKESLTLDAAIENSCRAAQNNSLVYEELGNQNASIDKDAFREGFSEAFEDTLGLTRLDSRDNLFSFTSSSRRWHQIDVTIDMAPVINDGLVDLRVNMVTVNIDTPYVFRTALLKAAVGEKTENFRIRLERRFVVQVTS